MAYIKSVRFNRVGRNEGCTCDKCGQYIRNIWTVTYQDGVIMNFGIDCFEKLNKGNLNAYGQKLMKDALKWIEKHQQNFEAEKPLLVFVHGCFSFHRSKLTFLNLSILF